ncbi:hypothetical protein B0J14DRAFT_495164 [Halenospora varia]|nr:hypothetical protein B0J14DRAFT_495164 [Halenospora varia]
MYIQTIVAAIAALSATGLAQKCPIVIEGRTPKGSTPATFDTTASLFDSKNVKGANLTFAQIIKLPNVTASLFDANSTLPTEITLSDASIFAPSATNIQTGFRRCELIPASNDGSDPSTLGVKVIHFSVMKDEARNLNTSHEYQMVFLESKDFSTNQIVVKTGTISGLNNSLPGDITIVGNVNTAVGKLFSTEFTSGWHNFGIVMDFDKNTTQILHSLGSAPLAAVTQPISNDISGQGQYHFGLLKKPTGDNLKDVTKEGFQEAGIDEGVVYGGVFIEEGGAGCVSLSP